MRQAINILLILICFSHAICHKHALAKEPFLDIQEVTSPSGLTAWLVEDHNLPIISIKFSFKGAGSVQVNKDQQGLLRLLSSTMDEGAGPYDSQSFQKELMDHSISLSFNGGADAFNGKLTTLTKYKDKAYSLLKLSLTEPRFDQEAIDRMRGSILSSIRSNLSSPDWIASRILADIAYEGHPYALNSTGTLTTLPKITRNNLLEFKNKHLSQDRLYISVVGDITSKDLAILLDELFGNLPKTSPVSSIKTSTIKNGGHIYLYEKDIPQTIIEIMQTGIDRSHPDYFTAQIMNFILGGSGFGSRLTEELREKRGLTYGIYSSLHMTDYVDSFYIGTSTKNEVVSEAIDLIKIELNKIKGHSITDKELMNAKSYLIGAMPLSLSSTGKIASLIHDLQYDSMPINYLDTRTDKLSAVTKDDIQRLANAMLMPENLTIVLVGKPENVLPTIKIETLPNVE